MNRNNTRIAILVLFIVAFAAAVGAFIALGSNSGDANSQPVASPPESDNVDVQTDGNAADSDEQDQIEEELERGFPEIVDNDLDSDVLVGDLDDLDDSSLDGPDNDVIDGDTPTALPNGLSRWCPSVQHVPPPGSDGRFPSGVQVNGEIFSVGYDAIQLQGPTLNGGDPLFIDVTGTQFEAPVGISEFGDHEILVLNLLDTRGENPPLDLLPTLRSGPGAVFPVGPDAGLLFEQECFEFPPFETLPVPPVDSEGPQGMSVEELEEFLGLFVGAHQSGDAEVLFNTLHPAVPERFGEDTCREYIDRTIGSIVDAQVIGVGDVVPFELDTPQGPIGFPAVVPLDVEFTTADGNTMVNAAHFPLHNGEITWLTLCGTE